jgi:hypothetical protein
VWTSRAACVMQGAAAKHMLGDTGGGVAHGFGRRRREQLVVVI